MQAEIRENTAIKESWSVIDPLSREDSAAMATLRSTVAAMKGKLEGVAARGPFNGIMERVAAPDSVSFEADTVGGISGWWAMPTQARKGAAILHLHGGWFNWGTASAFRNLVGHIAMTAGVDAFIPDYRLAPEEPFPAALEDAEACYRGLVDQGIKKIALTGDSAGGNLALALLSIASAQAGSAGIVPHGAVVLSPVTDLALTGESFETRAEADPYFVRSQAAGLVRSYLGESDPKNPLASPLYGDLAGLPPVRVHVGDDEVLLDDSRRYVERAVVAGVDAKLDVWRGMPHGFVNSIGNLHAVNQALRAIGAFMSDRLEGARAFGTGERSRLIESKKKSTKPYSGRLTMQIKDHVFIVTGASSGIGLSTAIALTERGAKVALLAHRSDALQKLAQQLSESLPVTVDMTKVDRVREAVRAVHQHYGRVDGLINNAGRSYAASIEEIEPAPFDEIFHLNVLGPIVAMQAVIPVMRAQGGGSIVNINSGTAFMTVPQYSVYSSSKRALLGFSLAAHAELENDRIVVSEIYPFITATNFGTNRMGNPAAGGPPANYADGDKPEFVASLIVQAIEEGQAQCFANDRLRKMAGVA